MKVIRDYPQQGVPADVQGTAKMALEILFLNSAIDATGRPCKLPCSPPPYIILFEDYSMER